MSGRGVSGNALDDLAMRPWHSAVCEPQGAPRLAVALCLACLGALIPGAALAQSWGAEHSSLGPVEDPPSVYLDQANVPRAKALALDAALMKGWRVVVSGMDHSVFETLIEEEPDGGEPIAVLLRIRADFVPAGGGVRVALTATEIRSPGTQVEYRRDVTEDYRANLHNALASLRGQWEDFALGGRRTAVQPGSERAARSPESARVPLGHWTYEAEQFATRQGCQVSEQGAVLLGGRVRDQMLDHETHRVICENRSAMLVRCDGEGCRLGR